MYKLEELNTKKVADLQQIAKELNIKKFNKLNKEELAYSILDHQAENEKPAKKARPRTKPNQDITEKDSKSSNQQKQRPFG